MNLNWLPTKAALLNGLKSLPLTIVLTVLIWMYAEAQFTATEDGVSVTVRVLAGNGQVVKIISPDGQTVNPVMISARIQGAKAMVDRLAQGPLDVSPDTGFQTLAYQVQPVDIQQGSVDTVRMLNRLPYFQKNGLTALTATPERLRLSIDTLDAQLTLTIPVWVSAAPETLAKYRVEPRPTSVQITVAGSTSRIQQLKSDQDPAVRAYIDITAKPDTGLTAPLRYTLPEGVILREGPKQVDYTVRER